MFSFRFRAPNEDFSQLALSRMDDLVYLLVYDEVAIDMLEDSRRRDTDIHKRLEKRWLGSITIPFSTLYANGRVRFSIESLNTKYVVKMPVSNFNIMV